jgi:hypothetical protein
MHHAWCLGDILCTGLLSDGQGIHIGADEQRWSGPPGVECGDQPIGGGDTALHLQSQALQPVTSLFSGALLLEG